jgi:hypothetical protein
MYIWQYVEVELGEELCGGRVKGDGKRVCCVL